jgi:hypothetical protein
LEKLNVAVEKVHKEYVESNAIMDKWVQEWKTPYEALNSVYTYWQIEKIVEIKLKESL